MITTTLTHLSTTARRARSATVGAVLASALTIAALTVGGCSSATDAEDSSSTEPAVTAGFSEPVVGTAEKISATFADHDSVRTRGIDIAAKEGTPIYAMAEGTVSMAGETSGYGAWVVLDHVVDGEEFSTVYAHMYPEDIRVATGDKVTAGQQIASVGNSGESAGPHVHVELVDGNRLEATSRQLDPMAWVETATGATEAAS
jgi:murein DD-endopeptidase MepM/ murein hydrolase activator NlpD